MNLYHTVLRELERSKARLREQHRQRFVTANPTARNRAPNLGPSLSNK